MQLWWQRPDQTVREIVPIEFLEYEVFLGSDSYLVINITCPSGHSIEADNNICNIRCGDGYRYASEECDDTNRDNGDG